jgi:hypothetical protein
LCKIAVRGTHDRILPDIVSGRSIVCNAEKLTVRT